MSTRKKVEREDRAARWHAVYGAMVAAQVMERFRQGRGAADDEAMARFVEEAAAVADMAAEAFAKPGAVT